MELDVLRHQPRVLAAPSVPLGDINRVDGLIDLLKSLPHLGTVIEVGCFQGVSAEVMLHFCDRLIAVDCWRHNDLWAKRCFDARFGNDPRVSYLWMESLTAASLLRDGSADLVYIDADHHEASVRADIKVWRPKVRRGGWLAGHDYTKYVCDGEVIRAVDGVLGPPARVYRDSSWIVQL